MSRSTSNFWRSSRTSNSHQSSAHHRGNSQADALAVSSHHEARSSARHLLSMRGMERLEQRRIVEERNFLLSKSRAQNWNPPVDLRLLDYETAYDENLMCPICRCPFVDPVVLTECDHYFCRECIRQTWNLTSPYNPLGPRGDCPACRTPAKLSPRSATSKILVNILDDLVVLCPKADQGCTAKVKRGEVQDHMSIYCGFALVECPNRTCELPVQRKDAAQGCLHFGVSCVVCHEEMQQCQLEMHWHSKCPDRQIACERCKAPVYYRDLSEHKQRSCPAMSVICPGEPLGCAVHSQKDHARIHAKNCIFAKLASIMTGHSQRLDEQEAAQKQMSRKLQLLEDGFANIQDIIFPKMEDPDRTSADPSSIPLLHGHGSEEGENSPTDELIPVRAGVVPLVDSDTAGTGLGRNPPRGEPLERVSSTLPALETSEARLNDRLESDFSSALPFPSPAANGPYASPVHHLLSMHESLRIELTRVHNALQELDGRHSMQILNENIRTREEMTYLGAQVAGLGRQVHWLTASQLQRQQSRSGTTRATAGVTASDIAGAGPSIGTAVTSAVRGAARIANVGREGIGMRRGPSEEGRTKL